MRTQGLRKRVRRTAIVVVVASLVGAFAARGLAKPVVPLTTHPAPVLSKGVSGAVERVGGFDHDLERSRAVVREAVAKPAPSDAPVELAPPGTKTALVIGIDDRDASDALTGAVTDAKYMKDALSTYGFRPENVTVLLENDATRARILHELHRLSRTPADGLAVFAWSGHASRTSLRTADGQRVYATEVAAALRDVKAPVWTSLAVCYAGAYALPGIVGPNRIATFSSGPNDLTYELVGLGSYLMLYMVKYAMLDGGAPQSVEKAFAFAKHDINEVNPDRAPTINDGISGDLALGPIDWTRFKKSSSQDGNNDPTAPPSNASTPNETPHAPDDDPTPPPSPSPTPTPDDDSTSVGEIVCGPVGC